MGSAQAQGKRAALGVSARFANAKDGQGAGLTTNADMGSTQVRDHCPADETGRQLLDAAMQRPAGRAMNPSARAYHRVLKLARTIADPSAPSGQAWQAASASSRRRSHDPQIARSSIGRDGWSKWAI